MKAIDLTKVYQNYKGMWVGFKDNNSNKVIASAKTLKQLLKEAAKKGYEHPLVMQIPKRDYFLGPFFFE